MIRLRPMLRSAGLPRFAAAALVSLAAASRLLAETATRPSKHYTIQQFLATTAIRDASFSPDEKKILFSSNETGIYNVYSVPTSGGPAVPLTRSTTDSTYAVSYFPADDRVLYTRDQGGNENNHLYARASDGAEKDLTPGEKLKAIFVGWTYPGDGFYVLTNERDPRFFDLYRYDAASYSRKLVFRDDTGYQLGAISDDGEWLALQKPKSTSDSDLYLWNAASKEVRLISKHEEDADFTAESFDRSSRWLYYTTNNGSEFKRLCRYELSTGKSEDVEKAD